MLLAPLALMVEAGRWTWSAWGVVARGLDRGLAGVMWPFERLADAMAAILRLFARALHLTRILRAVSAAWHRLLDPVERALRMVGLRISSLLGRAWWFVRDLLTPVARPVARAARRVGRTIARTVGAARHVLRRVRAALVRALAPTRLALAHLRARLRRR